MSDPEFDVAIIGAGIAGAALAGSLGGAGLRLALIEAAEIPSPGAVLDAPAEPGPGGFDARVSAITPASQSLLSELGAWERLLRARVCPYRHMHVWDAEGTGAIDFDAAELDAPVLGHIVENRLLTSALLESLGSDGAVTVFNPAQLESVQRERGHAHRLRLADGRQLSCRLLVAADGALSRVRELAGFATREWDYGQRAIVATVATELPHEGTAFQRFLPSGPLAFLPLRGGDDDNYCSVVWSAEPTLAEANQALPDDKFLAALGDAFEHRLGRLLSTSPRFSFPLRQRHAIDYVQPGLALVGDAAHTIHPLAGQGINLGLQDVAVLAEELLAAAARGLDPGDPAVLARYQRRRKSENLLMMATMDGFKRLFGARPLPLRWLRNTGLRLVGGSGPLKQQLMRHAMGVR